MAEQVSIRTAELQIRTVNLSKSLLKQFRRLTSLPIQWMENDVLKQEYIVGWFKGIVLQDEWTEYTLLTNNKGDYFLFGYVSDDIKKFAKQIYIP